MNKKITSAGKKEIVYNSTQTDRKSEYAAAVIDDKFLPGRSAEGGKTRLLPEND